MSAPIDVSPWKTLTEGGAYVGGRSKRFLAREVRAGRLRAARIGGRGEYLTRTEWLDSWVLEQVQPVIIQTRRRA